MRDPLDVPTTYSRDGLDYLVRYTETLGSIGGEIRTGYQILGWEAPELIEELTADTIIAALSAFYSIYPPLLAHLQLRRAEQSVVLGTRRQRLRGLLVSSNIAAGVAASLGVSALLVLLAAAFSVPRTSFVRYNPESIVGKLALFGGGGSKELGVP